MDTATTHPEMVRVTGFTCQCRFEDRKTLPATYRVCGKRASFALVTHDGTRMRTHCGHHKLRGAVPLDEVSVELRLDHAMRTR